MNRRTFLRAAMACGAAVCGRPRRAFAATRPNILFILTDDQGPWAWGGGGHPDAKTPNLDRLARDGAVLANYFNTSAVCSPTRASILTGLYPTENGITDWIPEREGVEFGLDPSLPVWPELLDAAGYRTALFGKWHVGDGKQHAPRHYGYDEFTGWQHGAHTSKDPIVEFGDEKRMVEGYTSDILGDLAIDFIKSDHNAPFLLSLHFWAPHANTKERTPDGDRTWHPLSDADWNQYKDLTPTLPEPDYPLLDVPRAQRMTREYLASVASVDRNVGRILDVLDERGLAQHTIVIFTSDHGFNMGHHGIWHKGNGRWLLKSDRGGRPNLWDTTLRAPGIIRWPGVVMPGTRIERTITNLDWFPTLVAMAGVSIPANANPRGRDFTPLLRGQNDAAWNDDVFVQYDPQEGGDMQGVFRAYRTPEWKLVRDLSRNDRDEFYDLKNDPGERNNVIGSGDPRVLQALASLQSKLRGVMADVGDPELEGGRLG